jgi:hypothetical protein
MQAAPVVTRVGFDLGWLCLSRCFLNFGRPVLLVDRLLLGREDEYTLGLEPFGLRNPQCPLPETRVRVEFHIGQLVALCADYDSAPSVLLAWHRYDLSCRAWQEGAADGGAFVLMIGNTYAVENNLAALWDCHIGIANSASLPLPASRPAA